MECLETLADIREEFLLVGELFNSVLSMGNFGPVCAWSQQRHAKEPTARWCICSVHDLEHAGRFGVSILGRLDEL